MYLKLHVILILSDDIAFTIMVKQKIHSDAAGYVWKQFRLLIGMKQTNWKLYKGSFDSALFMGFLSSKEKYGERGDDDWDEIYGQRWQNK